MLGVKFILKRSSVNHPWCQIKANPQLSNHSEDRTIGIGRLAHEGVGSFVTCDDDNVETEDLDVHDITCCEPSEGCITSGTSDGRAGAQKRAILVQKKPRTEHLSPLRERNPSGLERPIEEVVDEWPAARARW